MATIETRTADDGKLTYRAKVRIKGHAPESKTFIRKTDATRWAQSTEAAMREGRHSHATEARRHLFSDLVDRYIKEVLPEHPKNAVNTKRHLEFIRK